MHILWYGSSFCDSFGFLGQWIELFWYCLQDVCQNPWPIHNNPRWVFFIFIFLRIYNYSPVCLVARPWQRPWHKLGMLASWIKNYVSIASSAWSLEKIGTQTLGKPPSFLSPSNYALLFWCRRNYQNFLLHACNMFDKIAKCFVILL